MGSRPADAPAAAAAERFHDLALLHRGRTGLTQRELAARLGVHRRSVQNWEGGVSHPDDTHLRALLAAYLQAGGLSPGREAAQAGALWAAAAQESPRVREAFDRVWFDGLLAGRPPARLAPPSPPPAPTRPDARRQDWGEAPEVDHFRGRAAELARLVRWAVADRCRVVALLGLGGIGKTMLAARLAHDLATAFDGVYWRSLRNAPPPGEWLAGAIGFVAERREPPPQGTSARLTLLLELLRERRCLLALDNYETVLQPGDRRGRHREGYEGYGALLQRLGESEHRGCLLVTSREAPAELEPLAGEQGPVRALALGGLDAADGRALLGDKGLAGDAGAWAALVGRYGGNGLALRILGETIRQVFGGDIAAFLAYATATYGATFGGVRRLLETQAERLSAAEHDVVRRLAVAREPVALATLAADCGPALPRGAVLEAVTALRRRSFLELGRRGAAFTLQPVVLEFVTERLVEVACEEIAAGRPGLLAGQPLLQATAPDYVRRSQERLILAPLLERLVEVLGSAPAAAGRLERLLDGWRGRAAAEQGYGPGNAADLLRLLRGHLRGADLSRLRIRQAYLQEVELQDASLAGAHLSETVLSEAFDGISALAVSADGARVAAGTLGGEVRAWRVADRAPLVAARGHLGAVPGVALSADGRLLVSGAHDGTVRLWDVDGGREVASLRGHVGGVWGVALSADGRLVASGGLDGTVRLWDPANGGREVAVLDGQSGGVYGVALSGDGRLVAGGGLDGTVRLWDVDRGREVGALLGHAGELWGLAFSPDRGRLVSGGLDGTVRLWDVDRGREIASLRGHAGGVWGVALSGDGRLVASGGEDGTVRLWDAAGGGLLTTVHAHTSGVPGVALSGDGHLLASGAHDGTVRLWDVDGGQPLATLQGQAIGVLVVAFGPDGALLASGAQDGTVRLWDAAAGRHLHELRGHAGGVPGLAFGPDGRLLASGGEDGTIRLWEAGGGLEVATLRGHTGTVPSVAFGARSGLLASGGYDGTFRLWEVPGGGPRALLRGRAGEVWSEALSLDRGLVASGGHDGTVRLWEADGGREVATLAGHAGGILAVTLSADGRLVATGGLDGTVRLWEADGGREVATLRGHAGGVPGLAFGPDGGLVASGGLDGTVRLWDPAGGREVATLRGHTAGVLSVAFSPRGSELASGSLDGTVKLWDTNTLALLRTLRPDRRYERLDITGLTGITPAQRAVLFALGALDGCAPAADGKGSSAAVSRQEW